MSETLKNLIVKSVFDTEIKAKSIIELLEDLYTTVTYSGDNLNLETYYNKLLSAGGEHICPELTDYLGNEIYGKELSLEELMESSSTTWFWSANLGKYLIPETGESVEEKTGVILPLYGGTIDDWNSELFFLISAWAKEAKTIDENILAYIHPTSAKLLRRSNFGLIETSEIDVGTILLRAPSSGTVGTIKIKDIV